MENKKVSVIIPAYNESEYIGKTIGKFKEQDYNNFEIIVVDNSDDGGKTYKIAESLTKKVFHSKPLGLSNARNEGAEMAEGEILLFSDADSWLEPNGIRTLAGEFNKQNIVGSFFGKDIKESFKGKLFFLFKNWVHRLKIHEGAAGGTIFCSKDVFLKTGGFDAKKEPAEIREFIIKAKKAGAKYKVITKSRALISMRRYEEKGYLKTIGFWVAWKLMHILKINNNLVENYYKETKNV